MHYKLDRMCQNCPFSDDGAGLQLRLSLGKAKWIRIKTDLVKGGHFLCHKTTEHGKWSEDLTTYTKTGGEQICAGGRHYQQSLGIVSDAEQVMERLKLLFEARKGHE